MLNAIPVVGWLLTFVGNVSMAIPFWICWTCCGLGQKYFDFLPSQWQAIPFWNCVGLFMIGGIIRSFIPRSIVSATSNCKEAAQ